MYGLLSGLLEYFTRIMKWRSRGEILVNNYLQYLFSWNEFAEKILNLFPVCVQLRVRKYDLTYVMFKYFIAWLTYFVELSHAPSFLVLKTNSY